MELKIADLDICGHPVKVYITNDYETLGQNEDEGILSRGKYNVDQSKIWLDVNLAPTLMKAMLFHEVYEFTLGYFNVTLDPDDNHGTFMQFTNILWQVFKANQDILFGDLLDVPIEAGHGNYDV